MLGLGKVWNFFRGKKTIIGGIIAVITRGLVATGKLDQHTGDLIENGAAVLLTVGLAHKGVIAVGDAIKSGGESDNHDDDID